MTQFVKGDQSTLQRFKIIYLFLVLVTSLFLIYYHFGAIKSEEEYLPPIYVITATYPRPEQLAELTRLAYTLKHVKNLFWLIIEDSSKPTATVTKLLSRIGVPFIHLVAEMPSEWRNAVPVPRGVSNRREGLKWIRKNAWNGVFYFADDDNSYDVLIFEQMRFTKKVSMFPVGLLTKLGVSSPVVKDGKVVGFYDGWIARRKYPVDMAGFAVNVKFFLTSPNAEMPYYAGHEEDEFLKSLSPFELGEIEPLASECSEILVWHTQSRNNTKARAINETRYGGTNIMKLQEMLMI